MKIVVFSDRDGTLTKDEDYFLGSDPNWKGQVSFLDGVVEGIRLINGIPGSSFFELTNQSGVALQGPPFDNLTEERMHEVNRFIIEQLERQGTRVDGYFACPFVDSTYAKKAREKGRRVNPAYIQDDHPDLKPNTGMIEKALLSLEMAREDCRLYMVGDRASDIEMILRANGFRILIESFKTRQLGDIERVRGRPNTYIAPDFLAAAQFIEKDSRIYVG